MKINYIYFILRNSSLKVVSLWWWSFSSRPSRVFSCSRASYHSQYRPGLGSGTFMSAAAAPACSLLVLTESDRSWCSWCIYKPQSYNHSCNTVIKIVGRHREDSGVTCWQQPDDGRTPGQCLRSLRMSQQMILLVPGGHQGDGWAPEILIRLG